MAILSCPSPHNQPALVSTLNAAPTLPHLFGGLGPDFSVAQRVKNLPAMQETLVRPLDWEDPLEKGMAMHSLPGECHGRRSLAGYSLWGHKELDMTEQLTLLLGQD